MPAIMRLLTSFAVRITSHHCFHGMLWNQLSCTYTRSNKHPLLWYSGLVLSLLYYNMADGFILFSPGMHMHGLSSSCGVMTILLF